MELNDCIKPISHRKLKDGNWIIVADESNLLVVDEGTGLSLVDNSKNINEYDTEIIDILKENGFIGNSKILTKKVPEEMDNLKWKIARNLLFFIGFLSSIIIVVLFPINGIYIFNTIIQENISLWYNILFAILFAILTSICHEFMHIIFARNFKTNFGGFKISIKKSTATISMSHVWTWLLKGRIAAVSAGIILDLFILANLSLVNLFYTNWIINTSIAILYLRILWEFRFNKNCDGKIIARMLIDNPMIDEDLKNNPQNLKSKELKNWYILKAIGFVIEIIIIFLWIIPLIVKIMKEIIIW